MRARPILATVTAAALTALGASAHAQEDFPRDASSALARISKYVADYYSRAQSLIGTETIRVQPISQQFGTDGFARAFVNELRIEWEPREDGAPATATMLRKLIKANGRVPKPDDTPRCMDPQSEVVEPLSMFLPEFLKEYEFVWKGLTQEKEGRLMMLDFREVPAGPPVSEWKEVKNEDCVSVSLPGAHRGRIWAYPDTGAVSRIDMHLSGPVDVRVPREKEREVGTFFTVDRSDYSIRYRPVTFRDPDETLLLPATIDVVRTFRSALTSSRVSHVYSDYRRFLTGGRIVQ
jgi:hypothetical protein